MANNDQQTAVKQCNTSIQYYDKRNCMKDKIEGKFFIMCLPVTFNWHLRLKRVEPYTCVCAMAMQQNLRL